MNSLAHVRIHASQFPDNVRRDLLTSLRLRQVNHKFHYDSVKQTQKWLALHQAYSPWGAGSGCERIYGAAFKTAAEYADFRHIQLVGLCCGDGVKEARLIRTLKTLKKRVTYLPCDSSLAMVLNAYRAAGTVIPSDNCHPLVCDLQEANDLPDVIGKIQGKERKMRMVTFFGTLHNYEPQMIDSLLAKLLGRHDWLLVGANLASPAGYNQAVRRISKQYDNTMTHDWLCTFLFDLGLASEDGKVQTVTEACPFDSELRRISIYFVFSRPCSLNVAGHFFSFRKGQRLRLFFSYRYTPESLARLLCNHRIKVVNQWLAPSEEEGVFLCRRF